MIGWPRHTGKALGITTSAKTIRRFWMRLRTIPPIPFLIWVVDPVETSAIFVHWATTLQAWTDRRNSRSYGTRLFRLRGFPPGFSRDGITGEPLRRRVCECVAVPRAEPRINEGIA